MWAPCKGEHPAGDCWRQRMNEFFVARFAIYSLWIPSPSLPLSFFVAANWIRSVFLPNNIIYFTSRQFCRFCTIRKRRGNLEAEGENCKGSTKNKHIKKGQQLFHSTINSSKSETKNRHVGKWQIIIENGGEGRRKKAKKNRIGRQLGSTPALFPVRPIRHEMHVKNVSFEEISLKSAKYAIKNGNNQWCAGSQGFRFSSWSISWNRHFVILMTSAYSILYFPVKKWKSAPWPPNGIDRRPKKVNECE